MIIDSGKRTPEAQLRSFNDRFNPKHRKFIRSVRAAVRKRFPTANELAYATPASSSSPIRRRTEGSMPSYRSPHVLTVWICTSIMDRRCQTRRSFCWDRESRLASSGWKRSGSWHIQMWRRSSPRRLIMPEFRCPPKGRATSSLRRIRQLLRRSGYAGCR
jgi:hypothetical protein